VRTAIRSGDWIYKLYQQRLFEKKKQERVVGENTNNGKM